MIAPDLRVLFCGINPGLYTAAVGHHFARPGNRFWPALYAAGFTDRMLSPFDERELLKSGYGITNVVPRTTASADLLTKEEIVAGGERLRAKVLRYRPRILAVLGVGAYRTAFNQPKAVVGRQEDQIGKHGALGVPKSERPERKLPGSRPRTLISRVKRIPRNPCYKYDNHQSLRRCFTPANHLHNG